MMLLETLQSWQDAAFNLVLAPLLFQLGLGNLLEIAYDAMDWFWFGCLQLLFLILVLMPLERWRPVEPPRWSPQVRVDVLYTLIHRLGLFRLGFFFTLGPVIQEAVNALRMAGLATFNIDQVWPGVTDVAWVSFLIYLVVFDAVNYGYHRLQHQWNPLWELHAVHHSQRQLTIWSDNRGHLLDDALQASVMAGVALIIGVEPSQFVAWVAVTQLLESLHHANLRLAWWPWMERVLVSPRFHRLHHAIGTGNEFAGSKFDQHNFGVLFPIWDLMFKTARFTPHFYPTGVRDQVELGRNYGEGFWSQQWLAMVRLAKRIGSA